MRRPIVVWLTALLLALPAASWATPELQLFIDPDLNPGAFYDTVDEGWTVGSGSATVSAFMHNQDPTNDFWLIISTPEVDALAAQIAAPTVDSVTLEWVSGNPGMPPHGVFDTTYAVSRFYFEAGDAATIFDVQDSTFDPDVLVGEVEGYRKDFQVVVDFSTASDVVFHIDLMNATEAEEYLATLNWNGDGQHNGNWKNKDLLEEQFFAPFSKDATLVPEPEAALLFAVGALVVGLALRRGVRAGS